LVDILLNDITYDNCELNRTSIELYSNNDNATLSEDNRTLTMSNEGVWSVDTSKGVVKFVSNKDFYSNPTPIYYRVKDNCGAWSNRADIMLYRVVVESTSSTVTPIPVITPTVTSETEPISTVVTPTPMPTEDVSVVEPTSPISQDYDVNLKLGDRVWIDVNENGIQDNKEVGLKGIIVTLFTENGQKVETTTTNSNGYYLFSNLSRGNYYLSFRNIPSECKFTIKDAISDDTKDSDADKNGDIVDIQLDSSILSNDVGVVCKSSEENLTDCDCDDYESSIPALSSFYLTLLFIIFGFLGFWVDSIKRGSI